jgi:ribose transport system substrate-binding protein
VAVGWYVQHAPTDQGAPQSTTPGNYLFLAGGPDPYWDLCIAGAQAAAAEAGAKLSVLKPVDEGEEGLKQHLERLISVQGEELNGLLIGPIDPARQTTLINAAAEKFPVVTVDSDAPESRRMFHIGSSNLEAGMIAADMVKAALPEGGKVAVLMASEAKSNAVERKQGLQANLSQSSGDGDDGAKTNQAEYEIVGFYLDHGDFDACRENVIKACNEHDDLAAIVGTFGYHGPIILESLVEAERSDAVKVIAFDEDQRTLAGIDQERIYATIVQDPFMFGAEGVQMLEKVRNGHFLSLPVANGAVGVHCKAITKDNIDKFREQLRQRLEATDKP